MYKLCLVNVALQAGDLKRDISDPVPGSYGGFLTQLVLWEPPGLANGNPKQCQKVPSGSPDNISDINGSWHDEL